VAFDVFISYASKDKTVADAVCARLEAASIRCWIAPRDIVAGTSYGEAIIDAIHGAKVMVLVFSANANASGHIPKEVERAVSNGVAILPFRIEDVAPGKSLDYFIGSVHWLDAMTPPIEQHLDDLAATVHKLIPESAQGTPLPPTVIWQHGATAPPTPAPAIAPTPTPAPSPNPAPVSAIRPETSSPAASVLSGKTIGIGVAALLILAAIVFGFMRRTPDPQPAPLTPSTEVSDAKPTAPIASLDDAVADAKKNAPRNAGKKSQLQNPLLIGAAVDPVVGCYQWFNNAPVVIHGDGSMTTGPFVAHWKVVNAAQHQYTFTWPDNIETLTITPDQRSMSGTNNFGYPMAGGRVTAGAGMPGTWHWTNGWTVNISANGTFVSGQFRGTWRAINAAAGLYEMTWPKPVDSVTLMAGGTRIVGANQYGIAMSGVKTGACGGS
jgi:hypothetical protein